MHDDGVLTRIATPKLGVYGARFRDDRMLPDNGWLLTVPFAIIDECLARPFFATKQATHGILSIPVVLRLLWLVERPKKAVQPWISTVIIERRLYACHRSRTA